MNNNIKLSIIIPNHNHNKSLYKLILSIYRLNLPSYEIIIVDDYSKYTLERIVSECKNNGIIVNLITNKKRIYTKNARLIGIQNARGKYIIFADADDEFIENSALLSELEIMEQHNVDILHSPALMKFSTDDPGSIWEWTTPFATYLYGDDVFNKYVDNWLWGHSMWSKIYKRKLWLKIINEAMSFNIRHWREDYLLFSLYMANSKSYMSGDNIYYSVSRFDTDIDKENTLIHRNENSETAEAMYIMLKEFIPYLKKIGKRDEAIEKIKSMMHFTLYKSLYSLTKNISYSSSNDELNLLLKKETRNVSKDTLLKIFFCAYHEALFFFDRKTKHFLCEKIKKENYKLELEKYKEKNPNANIKFEKKYLRHPLRRDLWPQKISDTKDLKNIYNGKRCFIIGNGPSLNKINIDLLKNEITIGCNGIFYKTKETGFIPTIYTVEDNEFIASYHKIIDEYDTLKILPIEFLDYFGNYKNTMWFNIDNSFYDRSSIFYHRPRFSKNFDKYVCAGHTITYTNMQLAYWLGFSEIYLIGMDFEYKIPKDVEINGNCFRSPSDDENHFSPLYFKNKIWHDPKLDCVSLNFKFARNVFESVGKKIFNASVGGRLEIFDRISFDTLFTSTNDR